MQARLRLLYEQGYIGRQYDRSYRLRGLFATYYLLPKGIAVLKQQPEIYQARVLRNIRKDAAASERFIVHSVRVFTAYIRLKAIYGASFVFYTRSELTDPTFDCFPEQLPDGYATYTARDGRHRHMMLECFDDTRPQRILRHRIVQLVDHEYTDGWKDNEPYPDILIVCDTDRLRQKVQHWVQTIVEDAAAEDMRLYVVTLGRLTEKAGAVT